MRILLIEDDHLLGEGLARALGQSGHACDHLTHGRGAMAALAATPYDLVILDLGLPDGDGIDLLAQMRRQSVTLPVIILSARDGLQDRIRGLDVGGDDYLAKPFALGELEARIRALARRKPASPGLYTFGSLELDPGARSVSCNGEELDLTARELAVLELLIRHAGKVVSKQRFFEALYDWHAKANPSAIEVHVSRLRRKLEHADAGVGIRMLRGLGYRLELVDRE
ncbi:response regulator [Pseudoxanthomonas sp.]|uniref:response regulator n=1 Tax=Pseudoxanthomonas sp. TaxID=1871049 RepID=UPI00261BD407|nr:response regulator [Pseudoxanthomonas sp.]WDS34729.1 MAG: response regulator [Pseudoxanthomonas sp.]